MTNKPKAQGTRHESETAASWTAAGFPAHRIHEGGSLDEGDILVDLFGEQWVIEAKATQTLNVQETLGKARRKAGGRRVMVAWKRLVKVPGKTVRQPVAGERHLIALSRDDLHHLLASAWLAGKGHQ